MSSDVEVYRAAQIVTLDAGRPYATHVALGAGRIVDVGGSEIERKYAPAQTIFEKYVMLPGFVEGHAHASEGLIWNLPYVGYFDRRHPDGKIFPGCTSVAALIARLGELEAELENSDEPLFAWGYDSIYFADKPLRHDLDLVSTTRPVVLYHSNLHLLTVNSVALECAGISRDNLVEGVYLDDAGEPDGELAEYAAMFPLFRAIGDSIFAEDYNAEDLRRFGRACHHAGITTAADLYSDLEPDVLEMFEATTHETDFPVRIVPALATTRYSVDQVLRRQAEIADRGHERLVLGSVKIVSDGSIQGFSARVRQPYLNGIENGIWYEAPQKISELIDRLHAADVKLHIHVNGDEAAEFVLECFERAIAARGPRRRHVLQHAQMMDRGQLERAAKLNLMVNFFSNHIFYWGDQHRDATVGAEIAMRMNPARSALDAGLDIALHCDAPVTPLGPLFTMWCAVNRRTATGRELGSGECISALEALRAVTLGAARSLDLHDRVGSISPGKYADFTLLRQNPLEVEAMQIRDIEVAGTMLGGVWQPLTPGR
jgi:predicted amidohydrolase YtcJ